jgi:hypothetical protein
MFGLNRTSRPTKEGGSVAGVHRMVFVDNAGYHLTLMSVYQDGLIECWHHRLPLAEFADLVRSGWVTTQPTDAARVNIHALAAFTVSSVEAVDPEDFINDVADDIERLNKRPTSVDRARAAWQAFREAPSEAAKQRLRELYEAVPRHRRPFVGEMDGADYPIRRVLYPEQFPER